MLATFMNQQTGQPYNTPIEALWRLDFSEEIARQYPPGQLGIEEMFRLWAQEVADSFFNEWIQIDWFIRCPEVGILEPAPRQSRYQHYLEKPTFATKFTHPYDNQTNDRLLWADVPVAELLWIPQQWDSSGFIQQVTHWKPSMLQPSVELSWLTSCFSLDQCFDSGNL